MNKPKTLLLVLAGIAGAAVLVVIAFFISINILLSGRSIDKIAFDAEVWRSEGESTIRQEMVDDFLHNHSPIGMTRQEVIDLLGEKSKTHHFPEYDLIYWVGIERGPYAIDSEWLVLRLDDNDKVIEAGLVTD